MPCDVMVRAENMYEKGQMELEKYVRVVSDYTDFTDEQLKALFGVEELYGKEAVIQIVKQAHGAWHEIHEPKESVDDWMAKNLPNYSELNERKKAS